jgi:hypothetical protein
VSALDWQVVCPQELLGACQVHRVGVLLQRRARPHDHPHVHGKADGRDDHGEHQGRHDEHLP